MIAFLRLCVYAFLSRDNNDNTNNYWHYAFNKYFMTYFILRHYKDGPE